MPFNGSGTFVSVGAPNYPAVAGQPIYASQFNTNMTDVFNGFSNCVTRDGQSPATANIPMGTHKLTGLSPGTVAGDSIAIAQALSFDSITGGLSWKLASTAGLTGPAVLDQASSQKVVMFFNGSAGATTYGVGAGQAGINTAAGVSLNFGTADTLRATIDTSGNFYLGGSNPGSALLSSLTATAGKTTLYGGNTAATTSWLGLALSNGADADYVVRLTGVGAGTKKVEAGTMASIPLAFLTGGTERARLDTSGNFGIGMTPTVPLDITASSGIIGLNSSGATSDAYLGFSNSGTPRGYVGYAGAANSMIAGLAQYDLAIRAQGKGIGTSVDSGASLGWYLATTGDITARGVALTRVKASSTSRSATTTVSNDPDLQIPLGVGTWEIRARFNFASGATAGGFKSTYSFSGTISNSMLASLTASGSTTIAGANSAYNSTWSFGSLASTEWVEIHGHVVVTVAGTFVVQWAQNTASGTTDLTTGSFITATKLS